MIVLPMAGNSSRFAKAGYEKPKYMLELCGNSVLEHVLLGFKGCFESQEFLFICREDHAAEAYVKEVCKQLGIKSFAVIVLSKATEGQAETVFLGLQQQGVAVSTEITVFNIDTFRPGFELPAIANNADGYLEVFVGSGENWSFVEPGEDAKVLRTTEKDPISNLCSTGLYYFAKAGYFYDAYQNTLNKAAADLQGGERYIAPLYNDLIKNGLDIRYHTIDRREVLFCGVPAEYEELKITMC